jgi:hypothetical protein
VQDGVAVTVVVGRQGKEVRPNTRVGDRLRFTGGLTELGLVSLLVVPGPERGPATFPVPGFVGQHDAERRGSIQ